MLKLVKGPKAPKDGRDFVLVDPDPEEPSHAFFKEHGYVPEGQPPAPRRKKKAAAKKRSAKKG